MLIQTPSTTAIIGQALLAATLALAEDVDAARMSARARARCGALASASALAESLAWPVSRAARLLGVHADQVWEARRDRRPGFQAAEREAIAAVRRTLGDLARPPQDAPEDEPEDADTPEPAAEVIRLRPASPAILRWAKAYLRLGVSIDDLAELFSVSPEALAAVADEVSQ